MLCKILLIIYATFFLQGDDDKRLVQCNKKCSEKYHNGSMRNGSMICFYNPFNGDKAEGGTQCFVDCMGYEKPNQTKCWCDACKKDETKFCEKPYGRHITKEECDTLVCSGEKGSIKYLGKWCNDEKKEECKEMDEKYGFV